MQVIQVIQRIKEIQVIQVIQRIQEIKVIQVKQVMLIMQVSLLIMGFTGAHMLHTFDVFILSLYLLSHVCALLKYMFKPKGKGSASVSRLSSF